MVGGGGLSLSLLPVVVGRWHPARALLTAVTVLAVSGLVPVAVLLDGLGNSGLHAVVCLLLLAAALERSGLATRLVRHVTTATSYAHC